jgi:hypothetical protein
MKLQEAGQKVPALENKPYLSRWTMPYMEAFNVLSDSRSSGFGGVGPIPLSEIRSYMEIYEIVDIDERERFIKMVKALDSEYLAHTRKKLDAKSAQEGKSVKSARPRKTRVRPR